MRHLRRIFLSVQLAVVLAASAFLLACSSAADSRSGDSGVIARHGGDVTGTDWVSPGMRPRPGTYTFQGSGQDFIDLSGGAVHDFPERIPVTVRLDTQACRWTMRIQWISSSTDEDQLCTDRHGVRERAYTRIATFSEISIRDAFVCPEEATAFRLRPASGKAVNWEWICQSDDTTSSQAAHAVGRETLRIGGRAVIATHVRIRFTLTEGETGSAVHDWWLLESGLPVRFTIHREYALSADYDSANFRRDATYTIVSLNPAS